jgi:hypothetical protein
MRETNLLTRTCLPLLATALFVFTSTADAQITLSYGTVDASGNVVVNLMPNMAGQRVDFFASGIAATGGTDGMELDLQVEDGGTDLGGTGVGPTMTGIDLTSGTIWSGFGDTQTDVVTFPLARQSTVDTGSVVTTDGLVGAVFFDTTGFNSGTFDFRVNGVSGAFDTTFFRGGVALPTESTNGFLRISEAVPEPSSLAMLSVIGLIGFARRRRS